MESYTVRGEARYVVEARVEADSPQAARARFESGDLALSDARLIEGEWRGSAVIDAAGQSHETEPAPEALAIGLEAEGEYHLQGTSTWITADPHSVYLRKTDEGIAVDIYPLGEENSDPIASTYAFDADARPEPEPAPRPVEAQVNQRLEDLAGAVLALKRPVGPER